MKLNTTCPIQSLFGELDWSEVLQMYIASVLLFDSHIYFYNIYC